MKKEWFATSELVGVGGLPKSRQGLNKRAREDGWEKRRRKGVQGRGVEYSIHSLPDTVKKSLLLEIEPSVYSAKQPAALAVWMQIYQQLSEKERDELIAYILRVGVSTTLSQLGITPSDGEPVSSMVID
ncbi:DNA-binding protein [Pectobacterium versatile]|uniref:Cro/Cl family transcriptional regulator n=1 Tax=Pectobacterium versatile TaxID=2488639 RepID=A0A855MG04_9GAMM|nr:MULTISPECIES: DNA-binding protein [Pectobacterium]MBA0160396.1 putative DNA-binding transcriptional regulator [Pectobacterium versatile]MBA0169644.1 putative DNA-binding transcriptional regulator [Pectobacterium versatile]MBA0183264.1 putative DNA-binding transcriptional regulator [Pectobacterium versatile]MBQ4775083.1 putative DNA-binding transcriptional regulator [Pectobacterium versatile]MBQ4793904.1 putative DNA-binding transcriptional regulator [Pectobacterium versatile]